MSDHIHHEDDDRQDLRRSISNDARASFLEKIQAKMEGKQLDTFAKAVGAQRTGGPIDTAVELEAAENARADVAKPKPR